MKVETGYHRRSGNPELCARPRRLVEPRPQQDECHAQDGEDQNRRCLRLHLLSVQPKLGAVGRIHLRRLLIERELGIESQQEHE